jgi:hypothetical protein
MDGESRYSPRRYYGGNRLFLIAVKCAFSQQTAAGAVLHVYERAGGLKYGEVEVGQETVIFDSDTAHR